MMRIILAVFFGIFLGFGMKQLSKDRALNIAAKLKTQSRVIAGQNIVKVDSSENKKENLTSHEENRGELPIQKNNLRFLDREVKSISGSSDQINICFEEEFGCRSYITDKTEDAYKAHVKEREKRFLALSPPINNEENEIITCLAMTFENVKCLPNQKVLQDAGAVNSAFFHFFDNLDDYDNYWEKFKMLESCKYYGVDQAQCDDEQIKLFAQQKNNPNLNELDVKEIAKSLLLNAGTICRPQIDCVYAYFKKLFDQSSGSRVVETQLLATFEEVKVMFKNIENVDQGLDPNL